MAQGQDGAGSGESATDGPSGAAPARRRTLWHGLVPVMALAAGLLFGTSAATAGDGPDQPETLAGLITERNELVAELSAQADQLREEIEDRGLPGTAPVREETEALSSLVGTSAVRGPAVQVMLDDAGYTLQTLPDGYTVDDVVVHQQDVQGVINALWAGGAEAMMVQDQRIISTSAVRCVGNTLYLQGRVYSPPYTITAIGDPQELTAALENDPVVSNYRAWADILGLGYQATELQQAELPAFTGTLRPQHAQPLGPRPEPTNEGPFER